MGPLLRTLAATALIGLTLTGCMFIGGTATDEAKPVSPAPVAPGPAPVREITISGSYSTVRLSRSAAANTRITITGKASHVVIQD